MQAVWRDLPTTDKSMSAGTESVTKRALFGVAGSWGKNRPEKVALSAPGASPDLSTESSGTDESVSGPWEAGLRKNYSVSGNKVIGEDLFRMSTIIRQKGLWRITRYRPGTLSFVGRWSAVFTYPS